MLCIKLNIKNEKYKEVNMAIFNKVYKKVANNGNDSDYQLVGQVGVDGLPLDEYKYNGSTGIGTPGLVPHLSVTSDDRDYFLTTEGWLPFSGFQMWSTEENEQLFAMTLGGLSKIFSIPINPSNETKMGLLNERQRNKLINLPEGVGIDYDFYDLKNDAMIVHGYGNAEVTSTRYGVPLNIASFTSSNVFNTSFVQKLSNYQIKFLKNGLYMVELRFSVKGAEKLAKCDLCPYINNTSVRMLAISKGNEYVLNTYYTMSYSYLIDINENDTFDIRYFTQYEEMTTKCMINDIIITCIDSSDFFNVSDTVLTNRDTSFIYK